MKREIYQVPNEYKYYDEWHKIYHRNVEIF